MGKTAEGAVWLNEDQLPPYDYWQFWRNTEDADVGRFMRLFTELPDTEITMYEELRGTEINEAKMVLANEATALCHGQSAAIAASKTAHKTFAEGGTGDDLPSLIINKNELSNGMPAFLLLTKLGLSRSNSEARRLIKSGGARVNDKKIIHELANVTAEDINREGIVKISVGKKRHAILQIK